MTVRVLDEFGQPHDIEESNKLYKEVWAKTAETGSPPVYPLEVITQALEWGWWTCFSTQQEWAENSGVPVPDHQLLYGLDNASEGELRRMLMEFGGHVSWLEAQIGVMEGRAHALKQGYTSAVMVASANGDGKASEKSKEASAIAASETLRLTKRMQIEQETVIATAKGLLNSYQRAWETVSRVVTIRMAEKELATGRHA